MISKLHAAGVNAIMNVFAVELTITRGAQLQIYQKRSQLNCIEKSLLRAHRIRLLYYAL